MFLSSTSIRFCNFLILESAEIAKTNDKQAKEKAICAKESI